MTVNQVYTLVNTITSEVLGKSGVVLEDLSNIVDVGKELFDNTSVDNYVKTLVDKVAKMGAEKARESAAATLKEVRKIIGFKVY